MTWVGKEAHCDSCGLALSAAEWGAHLISISHDLMPRLHCGEHPVGYKGGNHLCDQCRRKGIEEQPVPNLVLCRACWCLTQAGRALCKWCKAPLEAK